MSSLNKLAIRGTIWTILGYGSSQVLRLGANLILTRLLVPEMFGLMALVNVFITGINLFSDVGIGPSIIQSPRGNEPNFYNTAWTIQVIRGFWLWLACLILAYPLAHFYANKQLAWLIPIVGFSTIISGFNSTALFTLNKRVEIGKLIRFDIFTQVLGLSIMIIWAKISPTIWALVIGNLIMGCVKMLGSHLLVPEEKNKFAWDKTALKDLVNFGRWIMLATAMTFLATQTDKLMLGKLFPLDFLGVYTVAYTFADLPRQVMNQVNSKVMFPVISQQIHLPRTVLKTKILEKRWLLLLAILLGLTFLICFGDWIILLLYDQRYHAGAWILPILAAGLWVAVLAMTIDPVLYALGKPKYIAFGNFGKFIYMLLLLPLSYHLAGVFGVIIVIAANDLPFYFAVLYGVCQENLNPIKQDIQATCLLLALVSLLLITRWSLGGGLPISLLWQK